MSEKQPILGRVVSAQPTVGVSQPEFGVSQGNLVCHLDGHRDWSSGLCDCTQDPTNCLMVAFCGPCVQCQLFSRMGEWTCLPLCAPHTAIALRARLRTAGGIQGSILGDCCAVQLCGACATCQMKREMDVMGIYPS